MRTMGRVVVAVVRAVDKEERNEPSQGHLQTWAYDGDRNTWTRMRPAREPDGWGNRRRVAVAVPDQNVILMENFINPTERVKDAEREQQIWTYRYGEPKAPPLPAPVDVKVNTTAKGEAFLSWRYGPVDDIDGFVVYRGEGRQPGQVEFKQLGFVGRTAAHSYVDAGLKPGTVYHYMVQAVADNRGRTADVTSALPASRSP